MTYNQLIEYIQEPQPDYHEQLILSAEEILLAYRTRTQAELGKDLKISQSQTSIVIKLLVAVSDLNRRA